MLPGFVRVPFLFADGSSTELVSLRLDRATRAGRSGSNRFYELVPQDTVFKGKLYVTLEDTVSGWSLGQARPLGERRAKGDKWLEGENYQPEAFLKEFLFDPLVSIKTIGGYKSKGFGRIQIELVAA
jgi:CRISPR/Cas system CMR subunit Cmr4 (Cas7 group RAMP superfamily)